MAWCGSSEYLQHRDGVPWWEAKLPRRFHFCTAQSRGVTALASYIERCACGAIRLGRPGHMPGWMQRNSRRKS